MVSHIFGGFQLEFVSINQVLNHMTSYNSTDLIGWNYSLLDWRANLAKHFFKKINYPPMRALEIITGHVIYNLTYTYKFQLKTTFVKLSPLLKSGESWKIYGFL